MKWIMKRFSQIQLLFFFSKFFRARKVQGRILKKIFTRIWYNIWLKQGYAKPEDEIIEKYQKLDLWSTDYVLFFLGVLPIGTIRFIITQNENDLPTIRDFKVKKVRERKKIMEVTLLTVTKRFRRFYSIPSLMLMRKMYQFAKEKEIERIIVAADKRLFYLLTRKIRFPFQQIGEAKMYEGSLTYPACLVLNEAEKILKGNNPDLYRFFTT